MQNRPICLNHGCHTLVTSSGQRWRPFCAKCHKAGFGNGTLGKGVIPFKTGKCTNDGSLGFECPTDYIKAPWAIGMTEIDHHDGNHLNNDIKNAKELCPMCHKMKSKLFGNFRVQNVYEYKRLKKIT